MSKKEKLLSKLCNKQSPFTWDEACTLMSLCGFDLNSGKGSKRKFTHRKSGKFVHLHEPHPGNEMKWYARQALRDGLVTVGELQK